MIEMDKMGVKESDGKMIWHTDIFLIRKDDRNSGKKNAKNPISLEQRN